MLGQNKIKILAGLLLCTAASSAMEDQRPLQDSRQLLRILTTVTNEGTTHARLDFTGFGKKHKLLDGRVWLLSDETDGRFNGGTKKISDLYSNSTSFQDQFLNCIWKNNFETGDAGDIVCQRNRYGNGWEIKYTLKEFRGNLFWKYWNKDRDKAFHVGWPEITFTYTLTPAFGQQPDTDHFADINDNSREEEARRKQERQQKSNQSGFNFDDWMNQKRQETHRSRQEEARKAREAEEARRKQEQERRAREEEARKAREAEEARRKQEQEEADRRYAEYLHRQQEEQQRQRQEEARKAREVEERRLAEQQRRQAEQQQQAPEKGDKKKIDGRWMKYDGKRWTRL